MFLFRHKTPVAPSALGIHLFPRILGFQLPVAEGRPIVKEARGSRALRAV